MNTILTILKLWFITGVTLFICAAEAGEVKQLTFGGYNRDRHICDLSNSAS